MYKCPAEIGPLTFFNSVTVTTSSTFLPPHKHSSSFSKRNVSAFALRVYESSTKVGLNSSVWYEADLSFLTAIMIQVAWYLGSSMVLLIRIIDSSLEGVSTLSLTTLTTALTADVYNSGTLSLPVFTRLCDVSSRFA